MELKDIISTRRRELKLTLLDIAKACDVSEATVSRWESGEIEDMRRSKISALAKILKVPPSAIVGGEPNVKEGIKSFYAYPSQHIPILTMAAASCGYGSYVEEDILDYISLPASICKLKKGRKYFSIVAEGDSMTGAGIEDGNILVFEETDVPVENKIGLFCVDDHYSYCKKFKMINGKPCLISMNENYLPIELGENFRTLGTLKFIVREV